MCPLSDFEMCLPSLDSIDISCKCFVGEDSYIAKNAFSLISFSFVWIKCESWNCAVCNSRARNKTRFWGQWWKCWQSGLVDKNIYFRIMLVLAWLVAPLCSIPQSFVFSLKTHPVLTEYRWGMWRFGGNKDKDKNKKDKDTSSSAEVQVRDLIVWWEKNFWRQTFIVCLKSF